MTVVYGYGKYPMVQLINKQIKRKEMLSISNVCINRWCIDEGFLYGFSSGMRTILEKYSVGIKRFNA